MSLPPLPASFPAGYIAQTEYFYTAEQMQAFYKQGRAEALEEAAESLFTLDIESYGILPIRASMVISDCNMAIRKLKS